MSGRADHILLTTDAVGGVWTYTQTLATGLAARGWRVTVACMGPRPEERRLAEGMGHRVDLQFFDEPLDWLATSPAEIHAAGRALARLAAEVGADSIHLHSPAYAASADFPVPTIAVSHSCLGTWWQSVRQGVPPADFAWRIGLHGEGLGRATRVICPSAAFARMTADYYGVAQPLAIPNGAHARALAHRQAGALFAFTVGRLWDEAKNIAGLDEAAARTSLPVVVAGDTRGPHGEALALSHVRQLGRLPHDEVRELMAARPVYVAPALYEPFGLGILEAAQAGCPLILGDIATLRDLWDGAALFVPPRDASALAQAMERLRCDDNGRAALSEAARARARTYDEASFVETTAAVHLELMGHGAREAASA